MSDWYILDDDNRPVRAPNFMDGARWMEANQHRKIVKQETIGAANVSTVFLGIDHNWGDGAPVLFETMVFGGEHDQFQDRCCTWKEAEAMHEKACAMVRGNLSS